MTANRAPRPVVLCVLDGWGEAPNGADNAIALARTPVWDALLRDCPHALLETSGLAVGLPAGQMGNSEVGHLTIGAGRVVMQDLPRIDAALDDGSLARHPLLIELIATLKAGRGTCHLMGLLSPGGVHSHQRHMAALARLVAAAGVPVAIHAFLDGRDTPPRSAQGYLAAFEASLAGLPNAGLATMAGRFYPMDRDQRWERVAEAYHTMVDATGQHFPQARAALAASYAAELSDEFVRPCVIGEFAGMTDGDGLIMVNFRADRVREILSALLDPEFSGFVRPRRPIFARALGLSEYSEALNARLKTLFPAVRLRRMLGDEVAQAGLKQLRIAETEKYAHVTFFFNGGEERVATGEERILVPSPKVATYDLKPEMAAPEVTDQLIEAIRSARFDFIVINYANTDMVGHTGDLQAAIAAVETVDRCLGRLRVALEAAGGALLITADHGNAEQMADGATAQAHTAHTSNLVPLVLFGGPPGRRLRDGRLADVAPTILALLRLGQPAEMTGHSLLAEERSGTRAERALGSLA
jgi:2,3-bisphosphoglycerate-independent phosphoglycerate mutase